MTKPLASRKRIDGCFPHARWAACGARPRVQSAAIIPGAGLSRLPTANTLMPTIWYLVRSDRGFSYPLDPLGRTNRCASCPDRGFSYPLDPLGRTNRCVSCPDRGFSYPLDPLGRTNRCFGFVGCDKLRWFWHWVRQTVACQSKTPGRRIGFSCPMRFGPRFLIPAASRTAVSHTRWIRWVGQTAASCPDRGF